MERVDTYFVGLDGGSARWVEFVGFQDKALLLSGS